jgi:hypothetical protein
MAMGSTNTILEMMADSVRTVLETELADQGVDIQVEPHPVWKPTPPTVDFLVGDVAEGTETRAFGGRGELLFTVRVRVAGNDDLSNWQLLNDLMEDNGDLSIAAALDSDQTLNGYATSLEFRDPTGLIAVDFGDQILPGRQFTVMVVRADS